MRYGHLFLMAILLPWFGLSQSRPAGTPAPTISPYADPVFQQAFFDAAKTYGKKGCGDKALAEMTTQVALKFSIPANLMAAIVATESSCNPLANNGQAVGIAQIYVEAHKTEYDFTKINLFNPAENMEVSGEILSKLIKTWGLHVGVARYNGSGPRAEQYARDVLALAGK
jgi:hypothetical protein